MISDDELYEKYKDCLSDVDYHIRYENSDNSNSEISNLLNINESALIRYTQNYFIMYYDKKILVFCCRNSYVLRSFISFSDTEVSTLLSFKKGIIKPLVYFDFKDEGVTTIYCVLDSSKYFTGGLPFGKDLNKNIASKREDYLMREIPNSVLNHFKQDEDFNTFLSKTIN